MDGLVCDKATARAPTGSFPALVNLKLRQIFYQLVRDRPKVRLIIKP